ncbi:MAG: HD family phosphohydrolase [Bacteroidota bacterium]
MDNFLKKLKGYTRVFYWIFVFVMAAVLLYLSMPGDLKFKYEYQKGFPWKHENLVAPFDFALLKTDEEINREKEEQLESVVPYFSFDTTLVSIQTEKLKKDWQALVAPGDTTLNEPVLKLSQALKSIYTSGILPRAPETYDVLSEKKELKKRVGNLVIKTPLARIHSEKTAYNAILNTISQLEKDYPGLTEQITELETERYISSNLEYDEATTRKEMEEVTRNISSTRGMIQTGERIILQGEIVDDEKYQILESLEASYENEKGEGIKSYMVQMGKASLVLLFMSLLFTFMYIYRLDILHQFSKLSFMLLFLVTIVFFTNFINTFPNLSIYLVPFAIFPIIIRTFFDSRTAIFTLLIATILTGFYAPNNYEFVLMQFSAGVVAVFSLNKMHRRVHLVMAAFWVFITYLIIYTALHVIYEGNLTSYNYQMLQWFALSSVLILLVYPLIFIFEKMFGFVSDVTLIELADTNQPLLRKMAEEAPGTFQHSMQIANLSEEIILKIGGNPFLIRAGALYHDIGKIATPEFFIENQAVGINPHDKMNYLKSAEIIIEHVKKGVKMAKKHKLPLSLVEFIATHHGTTKAQYFYLKHQEENPDKKIDDASFIYPGPLPRSKEAAVVMIVDGIEAASRSLKEKTKENIQEVVNNMIDQKIKNKQLEDSDLTFRDIKIIKETLLNKLMNIYHIRIEYPKEKKDETTAK